MDIGINFSTPFRVSPSLHAFPALYMPDTTPPEGPINEIAPLASALSKSADSGRSRKNKDPSDNPEAKSAPVIVLSNPDSISSLSGIPATVIFPNSLGK